MLKNIMRLVVLSSAGLMVTHIGFAVEHPPGHGGGGGSGGSCQKIGRRI